MSAPVYVRWFIADYLADTMHLTTEEHGAYMLLLMACYRADGKLPYNHAKLAQIARLTLDRWSEISGTILQFFAIRGALISHKRVTEEIAVVNGSSRTKKRGENRIQSQKPKKNNALTVQSAHGYQIPDIREEDSADLSASTDLSGERNQNPKIQSLDAARSARRIERELK